MKILVAEDCPTTRLVLERHLIRWGYHTTLCADGLTATELALQKDAPQLVILDWMMPGRQGPDVCRSIRNANRQQYTYIIFLTANGNQDAAIHALEAGADDFLAKPVNAEELRQRILAGRRIIELQDRLLKTQATLRELARRDHLTGLLNRRAFMEILQREIARSKLTGQNASVIMLDLDHFKHINDTWGHLAGDEVLKVATTLMTSLVGDSGEIGRYGGEEFAIVLPKTKPEDARQLAEDVCALIDSHPFHYLGHLLPVSVSVGVANGDDVEPTCDAMVQAADSALYQSKRDGRNRVSSFHPVAGLVNG